jgi:glycosyltransferase involved in cell wall biosynthesis
MTSSIRVIQTVASLALSSGGPTRTVTSLCTALAQQGVQVELVSTQAGGARSAELLLPPEQWVNTTVVPQDVGWMRHTLSVGAMRAALLQRCHTKQLTVLHDNGIWMPSNHTTAAVARALAVPLIISTHGMLEPWALEHRAWKKRLAWRLYQRRDLQSVAVLHATAEQEVESFRRLGFRQPIAMIPNGVDFPAPAEVAEAMAARVRPAAESSHLRTVLFLSRIHPKKGLLNLIEAWARVRPAGWRLVIAGPDEGGHRAEVAERIRTNGLSEQVTFAGSVDGEAKATLYRAAELFVLPTFSENFGVVVAEALAYGVPVITTKGAPWADLATHGCGWWVEVGVESLVAALKAATAMSDVERQAMGANGFEYVKRYNWEDIAHQMADVYRWMLKLGPRPDCIRMD